MQPAQNTPPEIIAAQSWTEPDYAQVYRDRARRLDKIRKDEAWDKVMAYYANDRVVEFVEHWLITYDPRKLNEKKSPWLPFILFPRQKELLRWMLKCFDEGESGLLEKSRDAGASWLTLAFALYLYLFRPGVSIGFGSRKEELVDNLGDLDSLLERVRLMLRMLPQELQPVGYIESEHARFRKIKNPETNSIITGEAGDNIGRGGRSSIYFLDEAAFVERSQRVEAALSANTNVRIDVSTPNGTGNSFYQKRNSGAVSVFSLHWYDDPRKDMAWFNAKKEELDPEVFAQEVLMDYEASAGDTAISGLWVRASQALRAHLEAQGAIPVYGDPIAGLDVGAGTAQSVYVPRWGPVVGESTAWTDADTTNTAGRARDLSVKDGVDVLKFDVIGVGRGVSASLKRMDGVIAHGINVGSRPTNRLWPDKKRSRTKFTNLKAELWWTVRDKLRNTYRHWLWLTGDKNGKQFPLDELLLLPNDPALTGELAIPRYSYTESGKIQIERKTQLEARGVPSPDHAEALILTFAPKPPRVRSGKTVGLG